MTSNRRPRGCRGPWTARRRARRASYDGGRRIATIRNSSPLADFSTNFDARAFVGSDVRSGSTRLSSRPAMPRPMDPLRIPLPRRAEGGGAMMELRRHQPVPRPIQAAPDSDVFPPPAKCGGVDARSEAMTLPTAAVAAVEYPQQEGDGTPRDAALQRGSRGPPTPTPDAQPTLGAGEPRPPREGRGGRPEAGGGEGEGDEGAGADAVRGEWRVDGIYGGGLVKEEQSAATCEVVVVRDENESGRQTRDPNETG